MFATPALAGISCNPVSFTATPSQSIHLARIKPGPNAVFVSGYDDCPNDTQACRQNDHVAPGTIILTGITHAAYTCAYYAHDDTEAAGWLPTARLQQQAVPTSTRTAWLGTWRYGDSTIAFTPSGRDLAIAGQAYWPAKSNPNGHEGHVSGLVAVTKSKLSFADADDPEGCKIAATLVVPFLIARDNNKCGGANVSFSGVYARSAAPLSP